MALLSYCLSAQNLVIHNATIVDVHTGELVEKQHLLIENGMITKIGKKAVKNKNNYQVIDATGKYLIPGMIDTHIHFFQTGSLYTRPDAIDMTSVIPYEEELVFAEELVNDSFKRYLRLGITTVMDVGGPFSNFKVRDAIATENTSPNVYVTGPLFSPYQPEALAKTEDVPIVKITSIEDAKKAGVIASRHAGLVHQRLKAAGFDNLDDTAVQGLEVYKKLLAGRSDLGISDAPLGVKHALKEIGQSVDALTQTPVKILTSALYIAANKKISVQEISRWQKSFDRLKENGIYDQILKKYSQ